MDNSSPNSSITAGPSVLHHALGVATAQGDLDSQITLTNLAGLMKYGQMRNYEALAYYQQALVLWQSRAEQLARPRAEPAIMLRERIGTAQWHVGEFDDARATLARALIVALYRRGAPQTEYLRRQTANALWALGLTLRSQSDTRDGDASLIRTALKRMAKAVGLYTQVGTDDENLGRLHVQIAELYLDLAELHLARGADATARPMRREARNHAQTAADLLKHTSNAAGKLLPQLTLLRYAITQRLNRNAARQLHVFEADLKQIESDAAEIGDQIISAKAATLRGEWLLWLGDAAHAREALLLAITGFQNGGMGMATRAQRLLRGIDRFPPPADGRAHPSVGPGPLDPPAPDDSQN